jgi:hypothetical protein
MVFKQGLSLNTSLKQFGLKTQRPFAYLSSHTSLYCQPPAFVDWR